MNKLKYYEELINVHKEEINAFGTKDNRNFFFKFDPKSSNNIEYVVMGGDARKNNYRSFYIATKPNARIMGTEVIFLFNDTELVLPIIIRSGNNFTIEYYRINKLENGISFELIKDTKIFA